MRQLHRREMLALTLSLAAAKWMRAAEHDKSALLRLSVLDDRVYAPTEIGNLVDAPYDADRQLGRLGRFSEPTLAGAGSDFHKYIVSSIKARTTHLNQSPVIVMVHGFLADPREQIDPQALRQSNNPHDFSYHYLPGSGPYWRHTASWPLGLGFAQHDAGRSGLAVAFGWNSTPDVLAGGFAEAFAAVKKQLSWADLLALPEELLEIASAVPRIVEAAKQLPPPRISIASIRESRSWTIY